MFTYYVKASCIVHIIKHYIVNLERNNLDITIMFIIYISYINYLLRTYWRTAVTVVKQLYRLATNVLNKTQLFLYHIFNSANKIEQTYIMSLHYLPMFNIK